MIYIRIKNNSYYDSITLTLLTNTVHTTQGVNNAQVMMGTGTNKEIFKDVGLYNEEVQNAGSNDMVIAIESEDEAVIDQVMEEVEDFLILLSSQGTIENTKELRVDRSEKEIISYYFSRLLPKQRVMGKIHSIFNTSFNIVAEDQLFNFSEYGMALSAYGCVLTRNKMRQLLNSCRPGDLVRIKEKIFTVYTRKGIFEIDLSDAEEVDLSVPKLTISRKEITQTGIYTALQAIPFGEEMGLENSNETADAFQVLKKLSTQSRHEVNSSIHYLIGRGQGLTPSGDDVLIGYTMIRKAFIGRDDFEEILQQNLNTQSTTDISEAFYDALFNGFISSLFISLILAVENATEEETIRLTNRIIRYGHTSGYDTLFGFYLGLQSLIEEEEGGLQ